MKTKKQKPCDFPGCSAPAKRIDIQTNWFRGDDVVLNACQEHKKPQYEKELLKTPKAQKQMAEAA